MISELRMSECVDGKGRRLWSGNGMVYVSDYVVAENALDWLWQRINEVKGVVSVFKEDHMLRFFSDGAHDMVRLNEVFLFSGTAREIVQQLRPYMKMMEGA